MTKVYIQNYNPSKLKKKEEELQNYSLREKIQMELQSLDFGTHIVDNQTIYRIEPTLCENIEIKKRFYKNYDCLFDFTVETKLKVESQLPVDYILTRTHIKKYKRTPKSLVTLIIEYNMERPQIQLFMKQSYDAMIPTHFYLEYAPEKEGFALQEIKEWLDFL